MLKLKIERPLQYLSPSSLMKAIDQPNTFYVERLIENRIDKEPQGKAAAIGSAFDILIKEKLLQDGIRVNKKELVSQELKKAVELKSFEKEAYIIAKRILANYLKFAYTHTKFMDIEIWKNFNFHGIPIFIKGDATCLDPKTNLIIPFDWKCTGFNPDSKSGGSPKKGFYAQNEGYKYKGAHKIWRTDIPIQEINYKFGIQFCTYGWGEGLSYNMDTDFPVKFDMNSITPKGVIKTSIYRAIVTKEFQKEVFNLYKTVWNELIEGTYINKLASQYDVNTVFIKSTTETWMY